MIVELITKDGVGHGYLNADDSITQIGEIRPLWEVVYRIKGQHTHKRERYHAISAGFADSAFRHAQKTRGYSEDKYVIIRTVKL